MNFIDRSQVQNFMNLSEMPKRHSENLKVFFETPGEWLLVHKRIMAEVGKGFNFVLGGKRGVGKTQIGCALIHSACDALVPSLYRKAAFFFLDIRSTFKAGSKYDEMDALKFYGKPQLLILDAVEERGETPAEDRYLSNLIDMRYESKKDTVMITNQSKKGFSESVGTSIVSRINETGEFIECNWPSFRGVKNEI